MYNSLQIIGKGASATVYLKDDQIATKKGVLGPYEVTALNSNSSFTPKLLRQTPTEIDMEFVPNTFPLNPENAPFLIKSLCEAIIDVSNRCRTLGLIPKDSDLVHRDIKFLNLRVTAEGQLKVLDWGMAIPSGTVVSSAELGCPDGTPGYIPPEGYLDHNPITQKFDSWAIGIILYQLLSGNTYPIPSSSPLNLSIAISKLSPSNNSTLENPIEPELFRTSVTSVTSSTPSPLKEILIGLLEIDPEKRLSPQSVLELLNSPEYSSLSQTSLSPPQMRASPILSDFLELDSTLLSPTHIPSQHPPGFFPILK